MERYKLKKYNTTGKLQIKKNINKKKLGRHKGKIKEVGRIQIKDYRARKIYTRTSKITELGIYK